MLSGEAPGRDEDLQGKPFVGRAVPTLATLHPAYLLRNPEAKRLAWRDMLMVKQALS